MGSEMCIRDRVETMMKLYNAKSSALLITLFFGLSANAHSATVDAVFLAQTHVQQTSDSYYIGLIGDREALIKAHIVSAQSASAPLVEARLSLGGQTLNLPMSGPSSLPNSIDSRPGRVVHSFNNSFTAYIPNCLLYTSPSPRDLSTSRMPSSA